MLDRYESCRTMGLRRLAHHIDQLHAILKLNVGDKSSLLGRNTTSAHYWLSIDTGEIGQSTHSCTREGARVQTRYVCDKTQLEISKFPEIETADGCDRSLNSLKSQVLVKFSFMPRRSSRENKFIPVCDKKLLRIDSFSCSLS